MPGTTLADAYVRIRSDLSQFAKEVEVSTVSAAEVAGKEAGLAFGAKFSETTKDLLKSAVTTVGILGLGEVVREAVVASDELTHATDALKVAAGDAGVSVDEATGHLKEASTEGEKLGFTNVEVARSYTSLLIKFHDANLATRLLAGSEDYAAFKHIGLAAAADRVGKAAFGSTRALRDMGVAVNSNTSLADRQQLVWQALARVQGQAEEATKSLGGQLKVLHAEFIDQAAAIVSHAKPALEGLLSGMEQIGPVATVALGAELLFGRKIGEGFSTAGANIKTFASNVRLARDETAASVTASVGLREAVDNLSGATVQAKLAQLPYLRSISETAVAHAQAATAVTGLAGAIGRSQGALTNASAGARIFGTALTGIKAAGSLAGTAVGGLVGVLGGPWGIAISAATIGLGYFTQHAGQQAAQVKELKDQLLELGAAYNTDHDANSANIQDQIKHSALLRELIDNTRGYGIGIRDVAGAVDGETGTEERIIEILKEKRDAYQHVIDTQIGAHGQASAAVKDAQAHVQALDREIPALQQAADENRDVAAAQKEAAEQAAAGLDSFRLTTEQITHLAAANVLLADSTQKVGTLEQWQTDVLTGKLDPATITTATYVDQLKKSYEAQFGALQRSDDIEEKIAADEDKLTAAVKQGTDAHQKGAHTLDIHTEAGRRNRDAMRDLLKATVDQYFEDIAEGKTAQEATDKHNKEIETLLKQADKLGLNKDQVNKLVQAYGTIPGDKPTNVHTTGFEKVYQDLVDAAVLQKVLSGGASTPQEARRTLGISLDPSSFFGALAEGGPVRGPGGPKADRVPIWGSAGEFMEPAASVDYYGPHVFELMRQRAIPREQFLAYARGGAVSSHAAITSARAKLLKSIATMPRSVSSKHPFGYDHKMAGGGLVNARNLGDWNVPVTFANVKIPDIAASLGWPGLTIGQLTATVASALGFLRAQDGKPYGWAQAGPSFYDCSGIVSAVWNILHGRSPYNHTFSTESEAPFFPLSGPGGIMTAGWWRNGEVDAIGHTAAVLAGVPFESTGSQGVHVGHNVTPMSRFPHVGHFDHGGTLERGWNAIYNGTQRREHLTPDVMADNGKIVELLEALIHAVNRVAPGVGQELTGVGRATLRTARAG